MKKFLRKNLIGIIAVAVLIACGGIAFGEVNSQEPDRGDNPLMYASSDVKNVFPEGEGYSLSKIKAMEYQLPEKNQQQENPLQGSASSSFNSSASSFSTSGYSSSSFRTGKYTSVKIDMSPTISTKLEKTQKEVTGDDLDFYLEISLYGKTKFDEKDYSLTVEYGKKELKGKSGGSKSFYYSTTVLEGTNYINVTLTDLDKKKTTKAKYEIVGVDKKEVTYDVASSGEFDTFEGLEPTSAELSVKKNESVKVEEVIEELLGDNYEVNGITDKKITSISGFGESVRLNEDVITELVEEGYEDGVDFYSGDIELIDEDGTVANNGIFPEGSSLTGTWTIYKVVGDKETEVTYKDSIKIKENTSIVLRYVIE